MAARTRRRTKRPRSCQRFKRQPPPHRSVPLAELGAVATRAGRDLGGAFKAPLLTTLRAGYVPAAVMSPVW